MFMVSIIKNINPKKPGQQKQHNGSNLGSMSVDVVSTNRVSLYSAESSAAITMTFAWVRLLCRECYMGI